MMTALTALSLTLIAMVLWSVRRSHIRVEYSVSWLSASVILLMLSLRREFLEWLAHLLGVSDPAVAVLMVVIFVFLVVAYRFSIRISALKDANIALAQRVAILEYHIQTLNDEQRQIQQQTANR